MKQKAIITRPLTFVLNVILVLWIGILSVSARGGDVELSELPDGVKSVDGEVSVYADFERLADDGAVPLYVINRTGEDLKLPYQDGNVYLKLEAKSEDGKWERVQPHAYSWCGNSYGSYTIRPGHYLGVRGYQPKEGKRLEVRYSFYGQVIRMSSNVGMGLVSEEDVRLAENDAMRLNTGDFDFVSRVALGDIVMTNKMDHITGLQDKAIGMLGEGSFPMDKARKVLDQVAEKFPAKKNLVVKALAYREVTLRRYSKWAMGEGLEEYEHLGDKSSLLFQKSAIAGLGSGRLPVVESREVLRKALEKYPELEVEIKKALDSLKKVNRHDP